jgi:hypothetical protein
MHAQLHTLIHVYIYIYIYIQAYACLKKFHTLIYTFTCIVPTQARVRISCKTDAHPVSPLCMHMPENVTHTFMYTYIHTHKYSTSRQTHTHMNTEKQKSQAYQSTWAAAWGPASRFLPWILWHTHIYTHTYTHMQRNHARTRSLELLPEGMHFDFCLLYLWEQCNAHILKHTDLQEKKGKVRSYLYIFTCIYIYIYIHAFVLAMRCAHSQAHRPAGEK